MKYVSNKLKEDILNAYFKEHLTKEEIISRYGVGADTLGFWIAEKVPHTQTKLNPSFTTYQSEADSEYHLFLKEENFLLDMPHYHESLEMICILTGSVTAHIGEQTKRITAGEICFANKFQNHFYQNASPDVSAMCLVLGHDFTHHFRGHFGGKTPPAFMLDRDYNEKITGVVKEWYNEPDKSFLLNCAYTNKLFDVIFKTYGFEDSVVTNTEHIAVDFIDYIENHYKENVTLSSMAKHFGYTKEYCSKLFNKAVGRHFNSFLNSLRIQKFEELLNSPSAEKRKITELIYECGFDNTVTFYRYYKKHKNKT